MAAWAAPGSANRLLRGLQRGHAARDLLQREDGRFVITPGHGRFSTASELAGPLRCDQGQLEAAMNMQQAIIDRDAGPRLFSVECS